MPSSPYLQITTTCDDLESLERLAKLLVGERLAACVQLLGPVKSHYRWAGQLESAEEWQLQAKTRTELRSEVYERITANHPYQVPELITIELQHVSAGYAQWLDESLKPPG